jgi:ADP-ribose pyrophosphatase
VPDPTENEPGQAIDDLTETVVASRVIHQGHYLTFRIDTIERADGTRAERDVVGHPGAVAILATDPEGQVLLVRQFRVPAGKVLLEIPAGTLDVDPATGDIEDHALAARRELEEETGYRAATWRHLASFWTAPGFATEYMHLWLATDLRPADGERLGPDEDEHLRLERMPFREAVAAVERGEIADAKSIVGLLWLDRLTPADAPDSNPGASDAATQAEAIRLEYRLQMREHIMAAALLARRSRFRQVLGTIFVALGVIPFVLGTDIVGWLPPIIFGLALMSGLFIVPIAWFVLRRRRELVEAQTFIVIDSSGVTQNNPFGQSHVGWQLFSRIRELGDWFFLDTGTGANFYIPKRAFTPADLAAFRKLIADAGFGLDGRRKLPTA